MAPQIDKEEFELGDIVYLRRLIYGESGDEYILVAYVVGIGFFRHKGSRKKHLVYLINSKKEIDGSIPCDWSEIKPCENLDVGLMLQKVFSRTFQTTYKVRIPKIEAARGQ